jgi:hypothetical protein
MKVLCDLNLMKIDNTCVPVHVQMSACMFVCVFYKIY